MIESVSDVGALQGAADSSAPVRSRLQDAMICNRMIDAAKWFADGLRRDSQLCRLAEGVHLLASGASAVVAVLEMERDRILTGRPSLRLEVIADSANEQSRPVQDAEKSAKTK